MSGVGVGGSYSIGGYPPSSLIPLATHIPAENLHTTPRGSLRPPCKPLSQKPDPLHKASLYVPDRSKVGKKKVHVPKHGSNNH